MNENNTIKVIAEDCLEDLSKQIYKWTKEDLKSVEISITDLVLMINHIEDLELEVANNELEANSKSSKKYIITRNEYSNAYAIAKYFVEADSKAEALKKVDAGILLSYEFDSWSEESSNWIDDEKYWEVKNMEEIADAVSI